MGGGASKREDGLQRLKKIKARIDSGDLDGALAECDAVQEAMLVNKRLALQLKRYAAQHPKLIHQPTAPLIYSAKGGRFTAQTIVNLFQGLYKAAGIAGASSHSGRRQFVTELADKGINARVIQALARHKHLNTTMRYIDLNENKLRAAVELVDY